MNELSSLLDAQEAFTPPLSALQEEEKDVEQQATPIDSNSRDKGTRQTELFETTDEWL